MIHVTRALLSVSDKRGIVEFASGLSDLGIEIISTGGTAALLEKNGIEVTPVSKLSNFPEILDGRVKTLTPQVHGGLLARRDKKKHLTQLQKHGIHPIDMLVVNLYPFERTIQKPDVPFDEAIENIDIGGPAMLRSSAKNFSGVTVITDPDDYPSVLQELTVRGGSIDLATSYQLAKKVFRRTAQYDSIISSFLETRGPDGSRGMSSDEDFPPETVHLTLQRRLELRYGENPHQKAALYDTCAWMPLGMIQADVLQGKALSYNNFLDLDSAWAIVNDFDNPAVAIVKHTNPCGVAIADSVSEAYRKALESDPVSAYGGIVGCNNMVTEAMAKAMSEIFLEAVIAPDYTPEALKILAKKKNMRLLRLVSDKTTPGIRVPELRTVSGGLLLQERDTADRLFNENLKIVTNKCPSSSELQAMSFAWKIVRHLKSNAVCFTTHDRLLSMGAGQTSRVEAVHLAMAKSRLPLAGSVLASDAFFPFRDGLDLAAEAGATAVIQPGGSIRDEEVISAADDHGLAMVFTGRRHFKH